MKRFIIVAALQDVPEAAREAILREAGKHEVLEVDRIVYRGSVFFDAEWIADGHEMEVTVTPEGKVVESDMEEAEDGSN